MTEGEAKPVGRPTKKDTQYVKLGIFTDGDNVLEWVMMAEECVKLLGMKGEEAAGYVLFHIRGGAKLELSMLGEKLMVKENIFEALRRRYMCKRSRCEIMREMAERKQGIGEGMTAYADDLLRMGRELEEVDKDWERILVDVFITNLVDKAIKYNMRVDSSIKTFMDARDRGRRLEEMSEERVVEVQALEQDKIIGRLERRVAELEGMGKRGERDIRRFNSESGVVRCYKCGMRGHVARWCRQNLNGYPSQ